MGLFPNSLSIQIVCIIFRYFLIYMNVLREGVVILGQAMVMKQ
jgi:hypothetical protein